MEACAIHNLETEMTQQNSWKIVLQNGFHARFTNDVIFNACSKEKVQIDKSVSKNENFWQ